MDSRDILDFFSSQEQQNDQRSSQGQQTISTDLDRPNGKTKTIKKKYQPINDGGKIIKYQDNPYEYKKARKKVQNRQSATRVRGRKKNAFDYLQQENQNLRGVNSQLTLRNARLETQNKNLKDQLEYMKTLIKPSQSKIDSIDQYFIQPSSTDHSSEMSPQNEGLLQFESPFIDDGLGWMRVPSLSSSKSGNKNWLTLTILTIIITIFVIPQNQNPSVSIASQTSSQMVMPWYGSIFTTIRVLLRYAIILLYSGLIFSFIYKKYFKKKLKNI